MPMLPTDIFPSKLCHVSPLSPDRFSNGKIISHENISITGEKINAIWATDKEDDQNIYLGKGFGGVVAIKNFCFICPTSIMAHSLILKGYSRIKVISYLPHICNINTPFSLFSFL